MDQGESRFLMLLRVAHEERESKWKKSDWTMEDHAALIGIVFSKFLYRGTLFPPKRVVAKICDEHRLKPMNAQTMLWNDVAFAFKYLQERQLFNQYPRLPSACKRRFQELKLRNTHSKGLLFEELLEIWNTRVNPNSKFLHPDCFHDYIEAFAKSTDENYLGAAFLNHVSVVSPPERKSGWTHLEHIVLVGLIVDKFIKNGSLFSKRRVGNSFLWQEMMKQNQKIWKKLNQLGFRRYASRSKIALEKRYKNIKRELEKDRETQKSYKRRSIMELYQTFCTINVNNALVTDRSKFTLQERAWITNLPTVKECRDSRLMAQNL